jgi:hypothetical protein
MDAGLRPAGAGTIGTHYGGIEPQPVSVIAVVGVFFGGAFRQKPADRGTISNKIAQRSVGRNETPPRRVRVQVLACRCAVAAGQAIEQRLLRGSTAFKG